jgi:hypothetical protein
LGPNLSFSEDVAINALKQFEWNLEVACDNYFANPDAFAVKAKSGGGSATTKRAGPVDPAKIDSLFETYRGSLSLSSRLLLVVTLSRARASVRACVRCG